MSPEADLELTLLAFEAIEARPRGDDPPPDFGAFRDDWRIARLMEDGSLKLALWRGPSADGLVTLTRGCPPETLLAAADHGPDERRFRPDGGPGSFLFPGRPRWRAPALADFGIFVGWWPAEPGTHGLRLVREGRTIELAAGPEGFVLVDWRSAVPVERFEAVAIEGEGWVPTVLPELPYTAAQLWRVYRQHSAAPAESAAWDEACWAYDLFGTAGEQWLDAVVAILRVADPDRDFEELLGFGADIYANGHAYYDRMERELERGGIEPANLRLVLSMEKPEFMDEALRIRHQRLAARCG